VLVALITSIHKLVIHQMNVKTTFLNGELEEKIYITQLEGCVVPGQEKKMCKLLKSMYGGNKHQNNVMKKLIMFYFVMIFLLMMLINVCTPNLKMVNVSLYVYMWMTC